jgi:hypothetical protein
LGLVALGCETSSFPPLATTPDAQADARLADATSGDGAIGDATVDPDAQPGADAGDMAAVEPADMAADMASPPPDMTLPDMALPDMAPPPPAIVTPRITELMARNTDTLEDEDGSTPDWIELHNPGTAAYDLTGHFLSDTLDDPEKWAFPAMELPAGGYLVIFASSKDRRDPEGPLHTNFKLSGDGESVVFSSPDGAILDAIEDFPGQVGDVAYGLPMREGRTALVGTGAPAQLWVGADPEGAEQPDFDAAGWTPIVQGAGIDTRPGDDAAAADLIQTNLQPLIGPASAFWLRVPFELNVPATDLEVELAFDDGITAWLDGAEVYRENDVVGQATNRPASRAAGRIRLPVADRAAGSGVLVVRVVNAAADDGLFFGHVALNRRGIVIDERPRYLSTPTPGAPNFGGPGDLGPIVAELDRHQPLAPGEALTITTEVVPTNAPVESVQLTWRPMFDEEQQIDMVLEGDRWTAELPADVAGPGEMIRWFVTATDTAGRTTRYPPYLDPADSEQYYGTLVDPGPIETNLPVYHWFVQDLDAANTEAGTRGVLWYGGELYDNITIDLHGQATTRFPKKSYNFDFNRDHRFRINDELERVKDFDLLTNYADKSKMRNTLAYGMFRDSGHDYHLVFPVRVHRNGEFFAVYEFVEDPDERWLRRMGYEEPLGAVYKCYDTLSNVNGSEKKTLEDEGTDDLAALIAGISQEEVAQRRYIMDHVDLPRMANFLAMLFVTSGRDCCTKNYYAYHSLKSDQWWFMPWDIDLTLGRNWTGTYFNDDMWPRNGLYQGRNNRLTSALFAMPDFNAMYLRRIRTLIDELMQPPGTPYAERYLENEADRMLELIGADAELDNAAWGTWASVQTQADAVRIMKEDWMVPRRQYLYGELVRREAGPSTTLIDGAPGATDGRWLIPTNDDLGVEWTRPDFDDAAWDSGPMGLGYERGGGDYGGNIRSQVRPQDANPNATNVFVRVRFDVEDPAVDALTLRMKFEDGYIAWINGVEVARRNLPGGAVSWRASAAVHDDGAAVQFQNVDITAFANALQPGENVLAIQLVNAGAGSSDLLLLPELIEGRPGNDGPLPPVQPAQPDVRIDEIEMAGRASYIGLENRETTAIDISGWRVAGRGISHVFPAGTVIPAESRMFLAAHVPTFRERPAGPRGGQGLYVIGNWTGDLIAEGELMLEAAE